MIRFEGPAGPILPQIHTASCRRMPLLFLKVRSYRLPRFSKFRRPSTCLVRSWLRQYKNYRKINSIWLFIKSCWPADGKFFDTKSLIRQGTRQGWLFIALFKYPCAAAYDALSSPKRRCFYFAARSIPHHTVIQHSAHLCESSSTSWRCETRR